MKINQTIPVFPSADFDRTQQFYEVMGFRVLSKYADYLLLRCDGQEIHFILEESSHAHEHGHSHIGSYVRVQGIDEIYERLTAAGITLEPPAARPWGMKEMLLIDPDGSFLRMGESMAETGA